MFGLRSFGLGPFASLEEQGSIELVVGCFANVGDGADRFPPAFVGAGESVRSWVRTDVLEGGSDGLEVFAAHRLAPLLSAPRMVIKVGSGM